MSLLLLALDRDVFLGQNLRLILLFRPNYMAEGRKYAVQNMLPDVKKREDFKVKKHFLSGLLACFSITMKPDKLFNA